MARFGIQLADFRHPDGSTGLFERTAAAARAAEAAGFDSLWVMDHFHQLPPFMAEAYVLLGALAARTERIRLGALVTGVTYRNPALLAKMVTTLDVVSGGRAMLGIGTSWNEDEYRAYGFGGALPPIAERLDRLEEALQVCRAMFREDEPRFSGRHYRLEGALNEPRPVRPGGPPILIGGQGERRLLRLVARYGDMSNVFGDPATVRHLRAVLARHCEQVGRDPGEIAMTRLGGLIVAPTAAEAEARAATARAQTGMDEASFRSFFIIGDPSAIAEQVAPFLEAGADELIFFAPGVPEPEFLALAGEALAPLTSPLR
jgi:F420-dependent oxidoreductase-like protein